MIMEIWNKFSYMIQLIIACMMFLGVVRRKNHFIQRFTIGVVILLVSSYVVNSVYAGQELFAWTVLYWMYFLVACVFFCWFIIDGTFLEALYCATCSCATQHIAFDVYMIYILAGGKNHIIEIVIYVTTYALCYFLIVRQMPSDKKYVVNKKAFLPIITIVLIVWGLSCIEILNPNTEEETSLYRILYRILDTLCIYYVLWVQINQKEKMALQQELNGINNAWRQKKEQYEVTQETIDVINRKCHDLKHQIQALRDAKDENEKEEYYDEIERMIMIYDTALQTGNRALDTVLMEKGLFCQNHNIQLTCMADGLKLDFMKVEDIYAIFGNALDNAIGEVMELEDPLKKIVSLKMLTQKSIVMIQIQNYYKKELRFEDGLPVTTKKNKWQHGFGMKSIRFTAEKYNGTITVRAEKGIFTLQILIPMP